MKAGKLKERIQLNMSRRILHGSRTPKTIPAFFRLPHICIFPLISSSLFSQIQDIFPISYLIGLSPLSLASHVPLVFLEVEFLHMNLCYLFVWFKYTPWLLLLLYFFPTSLIYISKSSVFLKPPRLHAYSPLGFLLCTRIMSFTLVSTVQDLGSQKTRVQGPGAKGRDVHPHHPSGGELEKSLSFSVHFY